jgi:hypothetical protein
MPLLFAPLTRNLARVSSGHDVRSGHVADGREPPKGLSWKTEITSL